MNIIEHLTRTVTPIVLDNLQGNQAGDRPSLLEKVYAIIIARLADNNISTPFASRTIANDDPSFFDSHKNKSYYCHNYWHINHN